MVRAVGLIVCAVLLAASSARADDAASRTAQTINPTALTMCSSGRGMVINSTLAGGAQDFLWTPPCAGGAEEWRARPTCLPLPALVMGPAEWPLPFFRTPARAALHACRTIVLVQRLLPGLRRFRFARSA